MIKNLGWIVLTGLVICLPAAVILTPGANSPLWYLALAGLARAFGIAIIAILCGGAILITFRRRQQGGLKTALAATLIIGGITSFATVYPLIGA